MAKETDFIKREMKGIKATAENMLTVQKERETGKRYIAPEVALSVLSEHVETIEKSIGRLKKFILNSRGH